jgi:hypothetical protein
MNHVNACEAPCDTALGFQANLLLPLQHRPQLQQAAPRPALDRTSLPRQLRPERLKQRRARQTPHLPHPHTQHLPLPRQARTLVAQLPRQVDLSEDLLWEALLLQAHRTSTSTAMSTLTSPSMAAQLPLLSSSYSTVWLPRHAQTSVLSALESRDSDMKGQASTGMFVLKNGSTREKH